ncbi:MAG: hypothetical protein GY940_08680, partial [bacterium]|nr:hypothetical protein [bacterium]
GGNSLDLVDVSNQLRKKLDREIPVSVLIDNPTISSLAHYLTSVKLPGTGITVPENFVLLNGSPQATRHLFIVHELLGDVGAYMIFSNRLDLASTNIWGVESEKLTNYAPVNVDVVDIASRYIRQMKIIQPHGPYYLTAWSWGGHVILEMALQLEKMGETIALLAFFDCPGPDYKHGREPQAFNLESEMEFLKKFFASTGYQEELEKIEDVQQLWVRAVEILTGEPALVAGLSQMMIANEMALPNYDGLTGEELVQYLNIDRIHRDAGYQYVPRGK